MAYTNIIRMNKKLFFCLLFFSLSLRLFAQFDSRELVALIPFWGENEEMIEEFGEELFYSVDDMYEYRPWVVDMTDIPPDVPEGGFPPYICPSPSLTGEALYALTGDLEWDDFTYMWRMRLYLWRMADNRLIYTDELNAYDTEGARFGLPAMVEWLFSWIPRDVEADIAYETEYISTGIGIDRYLSSVW